MIWGIDPWFLAFLVIYAILGPIVALFWGFAIGRRYVPRPPRPQTNTDGPSPPPVGSYGPGGEFVAGNRPGPLFSLPDDPRQAIDLASPIEWDSLRPRPWRP